MDTTTTMRTSLFCVLLAVTGCSSMAPPECQLLPSAQGGYVLQFTRTAAAAPGCDANNPDQTGDIWIFDTLAQSQVRAHAAVSMPYPDPPVQNLPAGLIGAGQFTQRDVDGDGNCKISSFTTMTDGTLSYTMTNFESQGGAQFQNAEFKAEVSLTQNACTAAYTVHALSPAVGCESDADCDPFKQPFSSGIFSVFDQGCHKDAWTAPVAAALGASGVCFFNKAYPSVK
jgi:hypothetical protein